MRLREHTGVVFEELDIEGRTVLHRLCGCGRPHRTPRRLHGPSSERGRGIETAEASSTGGEEGGAVKGEGGRTRRRGGRPEVSFGEGSRQNSRRSRDPEIEGISGRRAPGRCVVLGGGPRDLPRSRGVSALPDTWLYIL